MKFSERNEYFCQMYVYYFEKLRVWQDSRQLLNKIYDLTGKFPNDENYHLKSQMRRSAGSITSNLAEGQGRKTVKDQLHFTNISFSSLYELLNQLIIAFDRKNLSEEDYEGFRDKIDGIARQLNALRNAQLKKL